MNRIRPMYLSIAVVFLLTGGFSAGLCSDDYTGANVTVVKKATTTSSGQKMEYPKTDNPEVTALLVEIPPGGETGWHLHPVPVYAYILSGALTAEMETGETHDYKEGEVIFEAVNTPHNGKNIGKIPVRLIVFYTGEEGKPITVKIQRK